MMTISARLANSSDIPALCDLYRELETEMVALKPMWRLADGLPEPIEAAFERALNPPASGILVGELDDVPLSFLLWRDTDLLPQAHGDLVGVIELIFTTEPARQVGLGEAMISRFLDDAASRNIHLFDAVVPPGHRFAKNFFESNGFKARRIVMHRDDR
jgi:GNAT superfamily N-acetyltransferase